MIHPFSFTKKVLLSLLLMGIVSFPLQGGVMIRSAALAGSAAALCVLAKAHNVSGAYVALTGLQYGLAGLQYTLFTAGLGCGVVGLYQHNAMNSMQDEHIRKEKATTLVELQYKETRLQRNTSYALFVVGNAAGLTMTALRFLLLEDIRRLS